MAFELFQSETTGKYHFRLKAKNGEIILQSEAYDQKAGAENGISSVANNGGHAERFEEKEAKDGRTYFVLKATNGQTIGRSQMYKTESGRKNGIKSVMENARGGETKDLTA